MRMLWNFLPSKGLVQICEAFSHRVFPADINSIASASLDDALFSTWCFRFAPSALRASELIVSLDAVSESRKQSHSNTSRAHHGGNPVGNLDSWTTDGSTTSFTLF